MNQNLMPRNEFHRTPSGIVIGCAYIQKPYLSMDADDQKIQNILLKEPKNNVWVPFLAYIVVVVFALVALALYVNPSLTPPIQ